MNLFNNKDEEIKKINDFVTYGAEKPDLHYKAKWLGYIRFQGQIIRISNSYGCFFSSENVSSLPNNLKV